MDLCAGGDFCQCTKPGNIECLLCDVNFQDLHDLISQEVFTYQRPKTSNWMVPKTSQKLFPLRLLPWAPLVFKTHQPLIFLARNQVSDWIVLATTSAAEYSISAAVAHLMATPTRCVSDGAVSGPVSWS